MKKFILLFLILNLTISIIAQIETTNIPDTTILAPKTADSTYIYAIDLNGDTTIDYRIGIKYYQSYESTHQVFDNYNVFIFGSENNSVSVGPFLNNDTINQDAFFSKIDMVYTRNAHWGIIGPWPHKIKTDNQWAYIGIKFLIGANTHYGWIRLKTDGYSFTIDSYAYNRTQNQQIKAGQTQ